MKRIFYLIMLMSGLFLTQTSCSGDADQEDAAVTPETSEEPSTDTDNPAIQGKTLIVYYSFTNNCHAIASELQSQMTADVARIEPAEKGLDYAADNYALGSALIAAIRENPDSASSYPAIDSVSVNLSGYDNIIVVTPLWWSNMAAPMQTYLFQCGSQMAGKNIGLVVSSASSGISGVESDARRLIPNGNFLSPSLWIRSSQTSGCSSLIAEWLPQIGLK